MQESFIERVRFGKKINLDVLLSADDMVLVADSAESLQMNLRSDTDRMGNG